MPFNPEESREAHSQIGRSDLVAASNPPLSSPNPRGQRDPQPASSRGVVAGQPFPLGVAPGKRFRSVRPIPTSQLRRIYGDAADPAPLASPPPSWAQIGIAVLAVIALWLFLFALDGGFVSGVPAR